MKKMNPSQEDLAVFAKSLGLSSMIVLGLSEDGHVFCGEHDTNQIITAGLVRFLEIRTRMGISSNIMKAVKSEDE